MMPLFNVLIYVTGILAALFIIVAGVFAILELVGVKAPGGKSGGGGGGGQA